MLKKNISIYRKKGIDYIMLFIAVILPFLKYNFKFPEYVDLFYIAYFVYILITKSDSREAIGGGLILLITLPLLLIVHREKLAEVTANGAYYLLIVGVVSQLVSFFREKSSNEELSEEEMELLKEQLSKHDTK